MAFKTPIIGEDVKEIEENTDFELNQLEANKRHDDIMCQMIEMNKKMDKLLMYFALITNTRI